MLSAVAENRNILASMAAISGLIVLMVYDQWCTAILEVVLYSAVAMAVVFLLEMMFAFMINAWDASME